MKPRWYGFMALDPEQLVSDRSKIYIETRAHTNLTLPLNHVIYNLFETSPEKLRICIIRALPPYCSDFR